MCVLLQSRAPIQIKFHFLAREQANINCNTAPRVVADQFIHRNSYVKLFESKHFALLSPERSRVDFALQLQFDLFLR